MNNEIKIPESYAEPEVKNPEHKRHIRMIDVVAYFICLVLSFGIWAYVVSLENENYEYTFEKVAINLDGVNELKNDKGLSIISGYDETVNITVVGSRRDIQEYTAEDIFAIVDLGSVSAADRYSLDVRVELPDGMKLVSAEPSRINVFVDETSTLTIDFGSEDIDLLYNVAADLTIHDPQPGVDSLQVTGPKTILEKIAGAKITYDLGSVTTSVNFNAEISLVDDEGNVISNPYIKTNVTEVMVNVPVTMEKILILSPLYEASDEERFAYSVSFDPESVKVTGDPKVVSEMTEVKVEIGDITNSRGGSVTTANKLLLPENVKLSDKSIKTVSYEVAKTEIAGANEGK